MQAIPLTRGYSTIVDDCLYEALILIRWHAYTDNHGNTYARAWSASEYRHVYLARIVLVITDRSVHVDHANGNTLDNRWHNLRIATPSQNLANRGKQRNNTSGYKGVVKNGRGWQAKIMCSGVLHCLGTYPTAIEAAKAYDDAALRLFGAFAYKNLKVD